jgi:uncharacterized cupredoxin-like copper-binding protein
MLKLLKTIGAVLIVTALPATAVYAEAVVQVTLIDKAGAAGLSKPMKLGMGMKGDMKTAKMAVNANPAVVSRGTVKFNVTNLASELVHEVILAEINDENQTLAYDEAKGVVDEETIQTLGQVAEIAPSKSASFTLDLKPGKYILYCNYGGHFMAGMWTVMDFQKR